MASWDMTTTTTIRVLLTLSCLGPTRTAAAMPQQRSAPVIAPAPAPVTALAIVNARVWTGDPRRPWADAVLVRGERIAVVGSGAEVRKHAGAARVIDAKGMMVTPGFIDSHVHFIDGGYALRSVQLRDARTRDEFVARIKAYATTMPKGAWILNGDWDHTNWGGELPSRTWIDSVTPDNPVWINRLDGHMNLANRLAMQAAKVDRAAKDVTGGAIIRDATGELTGVFKDNAMSLVDAVAPTRSAAEDDKALDSAMAYVAARGVTSVHDMGGATLDPNALWSIIGSFQRAQKAGRLNTRIVAQLPLAAWARLRDTVKARGHGDDWIRIGGLKGFVDGSLGSHTAAMLRPFSDAPRDSGFLVTPPESLYAWTKAAAPGTAIRGRMESAVRRFISCIAYGKPVRRLSKNSKFWLACIAKRRSIFPHCASVVVTVAGAMTVST